MLRVLAAARYRGATISTEAPPSEPGGIDEADGDGSLEVVDESTFAAGLSPWAATNDAGKSLEEAPLVVEASTLGFESTAV